MLFRNSLFEGIALIRSFRRSLARSVSVKRKMGPEGAVLTRNTLFVAFLFKSRFYS